MFYDILYFVFSLGILVFVHELGHFIIAKKVGIKVEKFSIGMGPKIFGITRGETEYLISALPVGGYVKMSGEELEDEENRDELSEEEIQRKFYSKTVLQRMAVVSAGPIMNLMLAVIVFTFIYMIGLPSLSSNIGEIVKGSPAEKAGLVTGDRIVAINNKEVELWDELTDIIHKSPGIKINLTIERNNEKIVKSIIPRKEVVQNIFNEDHEVGLIGITPGENPDFITKKYNPAKAFIMAITKTIDTTKNMFKGLYMMISGSIKADVAGPVGIFKLTAETAKTGQRNLWTFIAFLSINLGILNLFPFPVLDGGHIIFLLIEKIKGSPIAVKYRNAAQQIGALILISLLLLVTYNDILRFIVKN